MIIEMLPVVCPGGIFFVRKIRFCATNHKSFVIFVCYSSKRIRIIWASIYVSEEMKDWQRSIPLAGQSCSKRKVCQSPASFSSRNGECVEVASFAQSAAEREKECEVESQVELSAFAGWRGRQFTDLARA